MYILSAPPPSSSSSSSSPSILYMLTHSFTPEQQQQRRPPTFERALADRKALRDGIDSLQITPIRSSRALFKSEMIKASKRSPFKALQVNCTELQRLDIQFDYNVIPLKTSAERIVSICGRSETPLTDEKKKKRSKQNT